MKTLVVYYSLDGNTRFIAQSIAQNTGADILELKIKKELSGRGWSKYFWGGRQVMLKQKPELLPLDKKPEDYDLIFIGTPVWAWNFTPALRSFFDQVKLKDKKIALFACCGGQPGKTFFNLKQELIGNQIVGEKFFIDPLKRNPEADKAAAIKWAREIFNFQF